MLGLFGTSKIPENEIKLIPIKRQCDNSHKHCVEIVQTAKYSTKPITQEYFNDFITMMSSGNYSNCLSVYYNNKSGDIKKFIITNSKTSKINNWLNILQYMTDLELYEIIINQQVLEPDLISKLIILDLQPNNYGARTNFLNFLITNQVKLKTFEYLLMSMNLNQFSMYLDKMIQNFSQSVEGIINKFITHNKKDLELKENLQIGIKILNTFIAKSSILTIICPLIYDNINIKKKKDIFNKSISTYDKNLMLLMLEKKDIQPDINTITSLIERSYVRPEGATNSKQIAEIIDLLCEYGLVINKQIVIKLLEKGCYVNNLEKHDIKVDNEILAKCANISYYPYKFDIIPTSDILEKECSKHYNLNTIKKLKEFGGTYTTKCLEEACAIIKNGRVIKFLVNNCGVKVSDTCLEKFQEAYRIDALDAIIKKYKSHNPIKKSDQDDENANKHVEINEKSTMTVTPRNIKINTKDELIEYELKNKIRKFFDYKKKTIKYNDLFAMFLKYLISNKLVIGKYFVINIELSDLLKISHCVIMNTNQIHNILTYFIDLPIQQSIN
jgi:hypothetical protein